MPTHIPNYTNYVNMNNAQPAKAVEKPSPVHVPVPERPYRKPFDTEGNYKVEFCKNWLETAKCRWEGNCRYAHG